MTMVNSDEMEREGKKSYQGEFNKKHNYVSDVLFKTYGSNVRN